jgi:hypothetical protein
MAKEEFINMQLDFLGKSIVTADSKGRIVETALPFEKYKGMTLDELDKTLRERGAEKGSDAYKGMKDLGHTRDSRLVATGDKPPERRR